MNIIIKKSELFNKYIFWVMLIFIAVKIFDGVIRYYLPPNLSFFVYIPIILMIVGLILVFFNIHITFKAHKSTLLFWYFLMISFITAVIYVPSFPQIIFGIYIIIPLIFGLVFSNIIIMQLSNFITLFVIFLFISIAGVFAEQFISYPWTGFTYMLSGVEIEGSRQWTTHGTARLAGFSRASFSAAIQIALLSILVIVFSKSKVFSFVVWLMSLAAIVLTTTKGIIVAYIFISLLILFQKIIPLFFLKALPFFIISIMTLFPLVSVFMSNININESNNNQMTSIQDRIENTWPEAFENIVSHGNALLGRGIGGIGTPQKRFIEQDLSNPADNMMVYVYGISGLLGVALLIYLALISSRLIAKNMSRNSMFIYLTLILIFTYGITTNVIEAPILSLYFGVAISHVFLNKPVVKVNYVHS